MVECKYRGRVIGWLVTGEDGFPAYARAQDYTPIKTQHNGTILIRWRGYIFGDAKRER